MNRWKFFFWTLVTIVIILFVLLMVGRVFAATNINSATEKHFAWNDTVGWIDFYANGDVFVTGHNIQGSASSSEGYVSLDCATSPNGNICASSNYGVCNGVYSSSTGCSPNASGNLSGYGWNDDVGWISFNCYNTDSCATSNYSVAINNAGDFTGWAWNDVVGWISFNYTNPGAGSSTPYWVNTSWTATSTIGYLDSSTVDTQSVNGATLNSVTWYGTKNANGTTDTTYVDFQVAVSNSSSGPWVFKGPNGDQTAYYGASCSDVGFRGGTAVNGSSPGKPVCIDPAEVANYRYIRYRVRLRSNLLQNDTPRVDNVILNWSK